MYIWIAIKISTLHEVEQKTAHFMFDLTTIWMNVTELEQFRERENTCELYKYF